MSSPKIKFEDQATGSELLELVFSQMATGQTSATKAIRLRNVSSPGATITGGRLVVVGISGLLTGGTDDQGAEVRDEQWVQVRLTGDVTWVPIGGPYGPAAPATNYLALADILAAGTRDIDVRLVIPSSVSSGQTARVRLGVARPRP